jgi:hypothetical protein
MRDAIGFIVNGQRVKNTEGVKPFHLELKAVLRSRQFPTLAEPSAQNRMVTAMLPTGALILSNGLLNRCRGQTIPGNPPTKRIYSIYKGSALVANLCI